jgi:integrase
VATSVLHRSTTAPRSTSRHLYQSLVVKTSYIDARCAACRCAAGDDPAAPLFPDTGKGRALRRLVSEISFHSLRHTATSLLKNAGVPEAVAMDIIGHYTHIETKAKRAALQKLPNVMRDVPPA